MIGCATTYKYNENIKTLVGQSEDVLIAKWGNPTARYSDENGDEVIAYIRDRHVLVPSTPALISGFSAPNQQVIIPAMPTSTIPLNCMTKFMMKNGIIHSFTFKGNDCKFKK